MMDSEAAIAQARAERDRLRALVDDIANGRGGGNYGDQEVADLARQHFRDYAEVILRFDSLVPAAVVRYLQEEGLPAKDVVSQVNQTVKEAWEQVTEGQSPAVDTVTARKF